MMESFRLVQTQFQDVHFLTAQTVDPKIILGFLAPLIFALVFAAVGSLYPARIRVYFYPFASGFKRCGLHFVYLYLALLFSTYAGVALLAMFFELTR